MALQAQTTDLVEKHRALEAAIEDELTRPFVDSLKLSELKREKLRVKEDLSLIEENSEAVA